MAQRVVIRVLAAVALLGSGGVALAQLPTPQPTPVRELLRGPAPKLVFENSVLELGRMYDDVVVERATKIRNEGDADLIITGVHTTCGCTVGRIGTTNITGAQHGHIREVVKPGESTELVVNFNPSGKLNAQSQRVTLTSNDPTQPNAVVEVRAFVEAVVRVDPMIVNLGDMSKGEIQSQVFTVIGRSPTFEVERITITGADYMTGRVLGATDVTTPEGRFERHVDVELIIDGTGKPQRVAGNVMIRTNEERRRIVSVNVVGQIQSDLALDGESLRLGVVGPNLQYDRTVRLRTRSGVPFRILGIEERGTSNEFKSSWIVTPTPETPATEYEVRITMHTNSRPGTFRGGFVVSTDVPDEDKVEFVYYGVVSRDYR